MDPGRHPSRPAQHGHNSPTILFSDENTPNLDHQRVTGSLLVPASSPSPLIPSTPAAQPASPYTAALVHVTRSVSRTRPPLSSSPYFSSRFDTVQGQEVRARAMKRQTSLITSLEQTPSTIVCLSVAAGVVTSDTSASIATPHGSVNNSAVLVTNDTKAASLSYNGQTGHQASDPPSSPSINKSTAESNSTILPQTPSALRRSTRIRSTPRASRAALTAVEEETAVEYIKIPPITSSNPISEKVIGLDCCNDEVDGEPYIVYKTSDIQLIQESHNITTIPLFNLLDERQQQVTSTTTTAPQTATITSKTSNNAQNNSTSHGSLPYNASGRPIDVLNALVSIIESKDDDDDDGDACTSVEKEDNNSNKISTNMHVYPNNINTDHHLRDPLTPLPPVTVQPLQSSVWVSRLFDDDTDSNQSAVNNSVNASSIKHGDPMDHSLFASLVIQGFHAEYSDQGVVASVSIGNENVASTTNCHDSSDGTIEHCDIVTDVMWAAWKKKSRILSEERRQREDAIIKAYGMSRDTIIDEAFKLQRDNSHEIDPNTNKLTNNISNYNNDDQQVYKSPITHTQLTHISPIVLSNSVIMDDCENHNDNTHIQPQLPLFTGRTTRSRAAQRPFAVEEKLVPAQMSPAPTPTLSSTLNRLSKQHSTRKCSKVSEELSTITLPGSNIKETSTLPTVQPQPHIQATTIPPLLNPNNINLTCNRYDDGNSLFSVSDEADLFSPDIKPNKTTTKTVSFSPKIVDQVTTIHSISETDSGEQYHIKRYLDSSKGITASMPSISNNNIDHTTQERANHTVQVQNSSSKHEVNATGSQPSKRRRSPIEMLDDINEPQPRRRRNDAKQSKTAQNKEFAVSLSPQQTRELRYANRNNTAGITTSTTTTTTTSYRQNRSNTTSPAILLSNNDSTSPSYRLSPLIAPALPSTTFYLDNTAFDPHPLILSTFDRILTQITPLPSLTPCPTEHQGSPIDPALQAIVALSSPKRLSPHALAPRETVALTNNTYDGAGRIPTTIALISTSEESDHDDDDDDGQHISTGILPYQAGSSSELDRTGNYSKEITQIEATEPQSETHGHKSPQFTSDNTAPHSYSNNASSSSSSVENSLDKPVGNVTTVRPTSAPPVQKVIKVRTVVVRKRVNTSSVEAPVPTTATDEDVKASPVESVQPPDFSTEIKAPRTRSRSTSILPDKPSPATLKSTRLSTPKSKPITSLRNRSLRSSPALLLDSPAPIKVTSRSDTPLRMSTRSSPVPCITDPLKSRSKSSSSQSPTSQEDSESSPRGPLFTLPAPTALTQKAVPFITLAKNKVIHTTRSQALYNKLSREPKHIVTSDHTTTLLKGKHSKDSLSNVTSPVVTTRSSPRIKSTPKK